MKPRTRIQREVELLRHSLIVRQSDIDWIEKRHTIGKTEYFAIYEVVGDWQVIRMFMYRSWSKRNEVLHEPLRYWLKADGSSVVECKKRQCLGNYYIDAWSLHSELTISAGGGSRDVRDLYCSYARVHSLIPELKRTNFRANNRLVTGLMPYWLVRSLLTNNRVETFFKLRQTWLTWKFYHYDDNKLTNSLWQAIRVALRHGYHWDNAQEINDWCDMVSDLQYLRLDTCNPHYICPANLSEAHTYYNERRRKVEETKRLQEELAKIAAYEPIFAQDREQFYDFALQSGKLSIQIIPTALAIKEEGIAMHHCVGGYYDRPSSLILSAKVDGKRMETIEVSLDTYKIVQSRGLQNKYTNYHNRIVHLMKQGLPEIRKRNEEHKLKIAV